MPEHTPDGRYIVVDGRRWRATDPSIPEHWRVHLVGELMDARRAVGAGKRRGDEDGVAAARARVQDAKVALGERGRPWWEPLEQDAVQERARSTARALGRRLDRAVTGGEVGEVVTGDDEAWRAIVAEALERAGD